MARLSRLYAPGAVHYVLLRPAASRLLLEFNDDAGTFVNILADTLLASGVALHAYVLLPHEFRFLATPVASNSIGHLVQALGRRYAPYLNRRTGRTGALWDRRYRSTLVDAERFLLPAMRDVERRPLVAEAVEKPGDWRWSSHAHHVGTNALHFVVDHPAYWALSDTPFARQAAYREYVDAADGDEWRPTVDIAVGRGWPLGDDAFAKVLSTTANRRTQPLRPGRPRSVPD